MQGQNSKLIYAKECFELKDFSSAFEIFDALNMNYEKGLCALLLGDNSLARSIWQTDKNPCLGTLWGLCVVDLINLKYRQLPSYFQIRAFLEVYLNFFIENKHITWAENLISAWDVLERINYETCKFIARVLFFHEYDELVIDFVEKSKHCCPHDPEALFIEAQAYERLGKPKYSIKSLEDLLDIVPDYLPALEMKNRLNIS